MKPHNWQTKTDHAPDIGDYDYTQCDDCGANALHRLYNQQQPIFRAFLAGEGLEVSLEDCDEAKRQIYLHRITPKTIASLTSVSGSTILVEHGGTLDPRHVRIGGSLVLDRHGIQQLISALELSMKYVKRDTNGQDRSESQDR